MDGIAIDEKQKLNKYSIRPFTRQEINAVREAYVVPSIYGLSVAFFMKNGGKTFIPLHPLSILGSGEQVNLEEAQLLSIQYVGESEFYKVVYKLENAPQQ